MRLYLVQVVITSFCFKKIKTKICRNDSTPSLLTLPFLPGLHRACFCNPISVPILRYVRGAIFISGTPMKENPLCSLCRVVLLGQKTEPHLSFRMSFLKGKHKESNTGNENMFERDCKLVLGKEGVVFQPRGKKQLTFLVIFVYFGGRSFYEVAFFGIHIVQTYSLSWIQRYYYLRCEMGTLLY